MTSNWEGPIELAEMSHVLRRFLEDLSGADHYIRSVIFHDLAKLKRRIAHLQSVFPSETLHTLAIKANPLVAVLEAAVKAGSGLEAASMEEVHLALAAGALPHRIVYDSPAKTREELSEAIERGVCINADHTAELERIDQILSSTGNAKSSRIGIRINPNVGAGTVAITSVGTKGSRFGLPLKGCRTHIVELFRRFPWLTGLHVHVGSQGCSLGQLVDGVTSVFELRRQIDCAFGRPRVATIDIGGGLPTSYRDEDNPPSIEDYAAALDEKCPEWRDGTIQIVTEFGRSIQAHCGWAASHVEYVKHVDNKNVAVIHLGADFMLRTAYLPKDWPHQFCVMDASGRPKSGPTSRWTVAGPLCFAGDILAHDVMLPSLEPGDWLIIRDVGAYTLGMWSRHCSRGMPLVIGYGDPSANAFRTLRRAESPADVVQLWSP